MSDRIDISLTDFVDFATKAGTPRLSKVREVLRRGDYHPSTDFWRSFREYLKEHGRAGTLTTQGLRAFAANHPDGKKIGRFSAAAIGYVRFIGRRPFEWFDPPAAVWTPSRLRVRINPELGLVIGGRRFVIKLYFKSDPLTKHRVDLLTFLLRSQLATASDECTYAVLDVAKGKLYPAPAFGRDLMPLLIGEAASFSAIYESLGDQAA